MESRESLMKVLEEQSDVSNQLRQAWKAENMQETLNFMVSGTKMGDGLIFFTLWILIIPILIRHISIYHS